MIIDTEKQLTREHAAALLAKVAEVLMVMESKPQPTETGQGDNGYWSAKRLAEYLDVPESWVYEQARLGKLPCEKLGRYVRFRLADVEAALTRINGGKA